MITWDEKKRKQVIKDHGIDLKRISDIFDDPFAIDFEDTDHSFDESRRVIIGRTAAYGLVMAIYAMRGAEIRCITARRAEQWMVRMYEKQTNRY